MIKQINGFTPNNPMSYGDYIKQITEHVSSANLTMFNDIQLKKYNITKLNLHRSLRINKQYIPTEEIRTAINSIDSKQEWVIITENWCGDSAQTLPFIARMAELNPLIELTILLRDENLEIMDQYLTNSSRSIPMLISFDEDGNELFRWGSRTTAAQALVNELKSSGLTKPEWEEKLHAWYTSDKGKELEKELLALFNIAIAI